MAKRNNIYKLEMLLLGVLKSHDCYGYEISSIIRNQTEEVFDVKEGTMYPILYKLLNEGYVSTYDKVINRKIRVYYHIEPSGVAYLENLIIEYREMIHGIEQILKLHELKEE